MTRFTPASSQGKKPALPEGRVPPANLEAEQSVLGGILLKPGALDLIVDSLSPNDFYHETHQKIFEIMLNLYQRREPVDLVSVTALLHDRQLLDAVGGPGFLASLSDNVGTAVNIEYYSKIVLEKSILRQLIDCSNGIAVECYEQIDDVDTFLDEAENRIFAIAEARMRQGFFDLNKLVDNEISLLEKLYDRKEITSGVATHFQDLDRFTAGLQKSDLIILAARPSMGKTALALNIAYNVAHTSHTPVAIFSLEMSKEQLVRRLLSAIGRIDASLLRQAAFLTRDQWTHLQEAAGKLMDCPIYIDDTPAVTVLEVRAKCRRLMREKELGLVLIDYLQLMRGRRDSSSREQEISEISRSLKSLAKDLNIPIVALSQLNRRVEERPNKRPQLADLRESGAIEQDADVILFIYRDEVYRKDSPDKGIAEIIIGKQRNGPTGVFKLHFANQFTRFDDFSEEVPPEF
ncbi:replicative DNA helicase [Desulfobacca acetoxidans]|uniref:Replicative DNA helicase n=1 Tax=Desulfobacca acetoxidans (strain ATCC 700848 / DSM 11109 / ASRB2) TaxID=880072 RepID=F2NII5_DESAR|nr:replicative DNA helicase [Desulfobacca acetoxidans]AEB10387.1 replicative DNA helicase [Desulfobacca acetoxidans DSM 11109]